ncbi:hypothetical protein BH10PAT3_BH10PAT3_3050 [soil metagenome]
MKRSLMFLSALLIMATMMPHAAHALENDGSFNLITSPLPINLAAKPGTTLTADIRIKNGGTKPETLKATLMKFTAYGEEGKPGLADREAGDDYFDWVSFSPSVFDAPPNEWITVKMTIALPNTAAFGYYYAAVFSRSSEPTTPKDKQNVIVGSTAVLVLVDAQVPNARREAIIKSFTADKKSYEFLPARFTIKIKNKGNVHLVPLGNIFISRGGKNVATLSINSASGNVLPDSNRIFTADWKDGFPVYVDKEEGGKVLLGKDGKPEASLKWEMSKLPKLRFGRYTAKLLLVYDDGTRDVPLEANVSFWVIPWRIIGGTALALLLVVTGLWSNIRKIYLKLKVWRKKHAKTI